MEEAGGPGGEGVGVQAGRRALLGMAWRGGALQARRRVLGEGSSTFVPGLGPDPRSPGLWRGTQQVGARALGPRRVGDCLGLRTPAGSPQPRHIPRTFQFLLDNRAHQVFLTSVPRKGVACVMGQSCPLRPSRLPNPGGPHRALQAASPQLAQRRPYLLELLVQDFPNLVRRLNLPGEQGRQHVAQGHHPQDRPGGWGADSGSGLGAGTPSFPRAEHV